MGDGLRDALDPKLKRSDAAFRNRKSRRRIPDLAGPFRAVDGVSMKVDAGEVLAIVGESGSGKSVAMLAAMGLLPWTAKVTADKLQFDGIDLLGLSPSDRRKIVGKDMPMIFQEPVASLNPCFTVGFQIEEVLRIHLGMIRPARRARAIELFELVGIPNPAERLGHFPHQMSGGQCQRVMIAIALACNPKLLIADEPTTALDVTIQKQILDLLMRLQAEHGMGLIMITHNMGVVAETADRVIVQYKGRKMEEADVLSLFESPKSDYTRALLSALAGQCHRRPPADHRRIPQPTTRSLEELPMTPCSRSQEIVRDYHIPGSLFKKSQDRARRQGRELQGRAGQDAGHRRRKRLRQIDARPHRHHDRSRDGGRMLIDGKKVDIAKERLTPEMRRKVQIVFQNPYGTLNPRKKIGDVLMEPLIINTNMPPPSAATRRWRC
jgi:dipeptide transport system ATP-binding protein